MTILLRRRRKKQMNYLSVIEDEYIMAYTLHGTRRSVCKEQVLILYEKYLTIKVICSLRVNDLLFRIFESAHNDLLCLSWQRTFWKCVYLSNKTIFGYVINHTCQIM